MPKGLALCVGINRVDPRHYQHWHGRLRAAENDAKGMSRIAVGAGFKTALLTGAEARRRTVLDGLRQAATLAPGDIFFFFFAGHGGQVPDQIDGGDEQDGFDETMCLFDGQLLDDEIGVIWSGLHPGVRVFLAADSCHSGTVSRAIYDALSASGSMNRALLRRRVPSDGAMPLSRAMPMRVADRVYTAQREFYEQIQGDLRRRRARAGDDVEILATVLSITACQDNQESREWGLNGIFSRLFARIWNHGRFRGTYHDFHRHLLKASPSTQSPALRVVGTPNPAFEQQSPFHI